MDLLDEKVKGGVYWPAGASPHVLGRMKVVPLRQRCTLSCYVTLKYFSKGVKKGNGLPGSWG
jgi:hypothetical protein